MPFTFLSHQAPVLPLKLARPRWFDGTALAVGSMAPDLAYALDGTALAVDAHGLAAQLWCCLPVTLVIVWLVRRVVAHPLAAHLPDAGPWHLRDYRLLAAGRPPLVVTVASALAGSLSHVLIDGFTHRDGWAAVRLGFLQAEVLALGERPVQLFKVLQYGGHVGGALVAVWLLWLIGRERRLLAWYDSARVPAFRPSAASALLLWGPVTLAGALGVLVTVAGPGHGVPAAVLRVAAILFGGVLAGCLLARRARRPERPERARSAVAGPN